MTTPEGQQPRREPGTKRPDLTRAQVADLLRKGGLAEPTQDSSQRLRGESLYLTAYDPHKSEPEL